MKKEISINKEETKQQQSQQQKQKNEKNNTQPSSPVKEPVSGFFAGLTRTFYRFIGSISRASIAGTFSGASEEAAGFPLDLVKTRLQLSKNTSNQTISSVIREVIQKEGTIGLFRGLSSPLFSSAIVTAIQFSIFQDTNRYLKNNNYFKSPIYNYIIAGSLAGFIQSWITCPVDLIKIQMQMQDLQSENSGSGNGDLKKKKQGNIYISKQIYKQHGISGFFKGIAPTLYRDVPGLAIFFTSYETFKKKIGVVEDVGYGDGDTTTTTTNGYGGKKKSFISTFIPIVISGGSAGVLYHGLTHPFDIAKTLIQTDISNQYKGSTFKCINQIIKKDGIKGCFKGFVPVAMKSSLSSAAGFLVYEIVLNI